MTDWAELLAELRELTASLVRDARSGQASAIDIERRVAEREDLFQALNAIEGPLPKEMEPLVTELLSLDKSLAMWCEQTQQKIAIGLVKRRRSPQVYADNNARIITHSA